MDQVSESASTSKKGINKVLLIIIVIVVAVLGLGGFAARKLKNKVSNLIGRKVGEKAVENMIENASGGKADVDIDDGSVTVTTKDGSYSTGNKLPDNWPSDVPVYTGATVDYSGSNNSQTGDSGFAAILSTPDSTQKVADFYKSEFIKQGWTIDTTQQAAGTTVLSAAIDTRTLTVAIAESEGKTTITLGTNQTSQ